MKLLDLFKNFFNKKPKEESKTYYIRKQRNSGGPPETEIHIFNKKKEK